MHSSPPFDDSDPPSLHANWDTTTPSKFFDEPIRPRRVPPLPHPQRKPQPTALTAEAHQWLARLPPRYQPLATARSHPHIVNRLSELWATPAELPALLRELMLSDRPGRAGFSFDVLTELADLQAMVELGPKGELF